MSKSLATFAKFRVLRSVRRVLAPVAWCRARAHRVRMSHVVARERATRQQYLTANQVQASRYQLSDASLSIGAMFVDSFELVVHALVVHLELVSADGQVVDSRRLAPRDFTVVFHREAPDAHDTLAVAAMWETSCVPLTALWEIPSPDVAFTQVIISDGDRELTATSTRRTFTDLM